jgi:hypothetical protein
MRLNHFGLMLALPLLASCSQPAVAQAKPPSAHWGTLQQGAFSVGFQRLDLYDKTRAYGNSAKGRPVQVSFWYPATPGPNAKRVVLNQYLMTAARAQNLDNPPQDLMNRRRAGFREGLGMVVPAQVDRLQEILESESAAFWNAAPAKGKFPLILNVESATTSHSVLSEFLASHGYVVATVERTAVAPGGPAGSGPDPNATEAIVTDMHFAREQLTSKAFVDATKLGITGINATQDGFLYECIYGGVTAIAAVDSGLEEEWMRRHPSYESSKVTMPVIHVGHGGNWPLGLSSGRAYRQLVEVPRAKHPELYATAMTSGTPTPLQRTAYQAACQYTLRFFNAFIKNDRQARTWLQNSPQQNGFGEEVRTQVLR